MTELWAGGLGIVTGLVLVLGAVSVHNRMRNRLRDAVVRSRPGAVVIPAFAEGPLPRALAIAVLGDRIEVWDGGGRHRTTMALTGATISVQRVRTGGGSYRGSGSSRVGTRCRSSHTSLRRCERATWSAHSASSARTPPTTCVPERPAPA